MALIAICLAVGCVLVVAEILRRRAKWQREVEEHCIEPEALQALMESKADVLLFDVRLPLDLLVYPEIIPGATRVAPKEVLANPQLIPSDKDAVVYCTCPSDETSRSVLRRAQELNFQRIKLLKGGLAGWKAKGFPVEPYNQSFRLDTAE